jgi:hypothetical protein
MNGNVILDVMKKVAVSSPPKKIRQSSFHVPLPRQRRSQKCPRLQELNPREQEMEKKERSARHKILVGLASNFPSRELNHRRIGSRPSDR